MDLMSAADAAEKLGITERQVLPAGRSAARGRPAAGGWTELAVPEALMKVLVTAAGELSEGRSITVLPADAWLASCEVAEMLGLSRSFVDRLLDDATCRRNGCLAAGIGRCG